MGFGGHGSIRSPIHKTNTPLGLDMGTWGLGDMGGDTRTRGLGDMGEMGRSWGEHEDLGPWGNMAVWGHG